MHCPACSATNPADARFCEECGARLDALCPSCGASVPEGKKFCRNCGTALTRGGAAARPPKDPGAGTATEPPQATALQGERRQAAMLFADICGYTDLCRRLDAEQVQALLDRFYALVDGIVEGYGGHVLDHAGDGLVAAFGAPVAHGNDAERAVRAALDMHVQAGQLADGSGHNLELHIGITAGEVVAAVLSGGARPKYSITGDVVNLAARLNAAALPGQTLVSEALRDAVSAAVDTEALGELTLKGFAQPIPVWRVLGMRASAAGHRPFIGRSAELRQLVGLIEDVREHRKGAVVFVRGETGIGKSRLAQEVRAQAAARGFACHTGHVLDFGTAKGRYAVPIVIKSILGIAAHADEAACRDGVLRGLAQGLIDADHELVIEDLLDVTQPQERQALLDAMDGDTRNRRRVEAMAALCSRAAQRQPQLLVFEDVHWATSILMRYLAELALAAAQRPLILIMTSRVDGDPLDKTWRASIGGTPLTSIDLGPLRPEECRLMAGELLLSAERFVLDAIERSAGNPLFLDQLLRSARESAAPQIPATIQSVVLARMDRLALPDKQALQAASTIGKRFGLQVLRDLIEQPDYRCDALVAGDLVRPEDGDFLFANALIQEGAYASLLNSRKRELHRKAAAWFAQGGDLVLRAQHLERAEEPEAAQAYLDAAADRGRRHFHGLALRLAERGAALATDRPTQYALTMLRGDLLREVGQPAESLVVFRAALELADAPAQRCRAWLGEAECGRVTGEIDLALRALEQAQPIAEQLDLARECSRIHGTRGSLFYVQGKVAACNEEHRQALDHARRAGDPECEARALSGLGDAHYAEGRFLTALDYFRGCIDIAQRSSLARVEIPNRTLAALCQRMKLEFGAALAECRTVGEIAGRAGVLHAETVAQHSLALLLVEMAEYGEAEQALTRALSLARRAGIKRFQSSGACLLGLVATAQNRPLDAAEHLRQALDIARQVGMHFFGPPTYAAIALASANLDEGRSALHDGEALLARGGLSHNYLWYYRIAIDAALAMRDWTQALHYAQRLEEYGQREPVPWIDLVVACARARAAAGEAGADTVTRSRLMELRDATRTARFGALLRGVEATLAVA